MRVLLIEDDKNKLKHISAYLRTAFPDIELIERSSYQSGLETIMCESVDMLLLDMSLPTYDVSLEEDGYEFDGFAGREILAELKRHNVTLPAVVITQFETFGEGDEIVTLEELDRQMKEQYGSLYRGAIYYSASQSEWKRSLQQIIGSFTSVRL